MAISLYSQRGGDGLIDVDDVRHVQVRFGVNVNTADWPELANLPGIGETLARNVVQHRGRLKMNRFESQEELTTVVGIGKSKLDKIRPFLLPISDAAATR
jgi:competence protein ComEA